MKRVIARLAAVALLGGMLAVGEAALARDHDGGGRDERHEQRGGGEGRDRPGPGWRGEDRGGGRRDWDPRAFGPPPGYAQRYEPQYGPSYPPQFAPRARRGGYLAPDSGGFVPDYGRYRLRQPPRGYVWMRTANGYAMVRMETGQVFDVVPF